MAFIMCLTLINIFIVISTCPPHVHLDVTIMYEKVQRITYKRKELSTLNMFTRFLTLKLKA